MAQHELLNNVTHKDLRIITKKSPAYGDNVPGCFIFPEEFTAVQREYPIFFQKDEQTNLFQAVAIFGFAEGENLFLTEDGWKADYIPAVIEREPFLIGFQRSSNPGEEPNAVIHINMEHPRVSTSEEGELVFFPHGGNTPYVDHISKMLMLIHHGMDANKAMFEAFTALDLLEQFTLDIEFINGERYQSSAYFTINQDKFYALDDASLGKLHKSGFLYSAYMVIASLGNIHRLIDLRNKRGL